MVYVKSLPISALCAILGVALLAGCGSGGSKKASSPKKSNANTRQQEDVVLTSLKIALSAQEEGAETIAKARSGSGTKTAPAPRVKSVSEAEEAKASTPSASPLSGQPVPYRDFEPLPDKPVAKDKDGDPIPKGLLFDTRTGRRYIGIRFSPENGSKLLKLDDRTNVKAKDAKVFSPTTGSYYTTGKFCPIHGVPLKMVRF